MSQPLFSATLTVTIGADILLATLRRDLAPNSCRRVKELMPYRGEVILWSRQSVLPQESRSGQPRPGDVPFFAGEKRAPELLIAYGPTRFASKSGPLEGNVVLTIDHRHARLAELGRECLWRGALPVRIE
jgi:hypothetical protein